MARGYAERVYGARNIPSVRDVKNAEFGVRSAERRYIFASAKIFILKGGVKFSHLL